MGGVASRKPKPRFARPTLELLENRLAPARLNFIGYTSDFLDPTNWVSLDSVESPRAPESDDELFITDPNNLSIVNLELNTDFAANSITIAPGFSLTLNANLTAEALYANGAAIDGTGDLAINATLTATDTAFASTGTLTINADATATIATAQSTNSILVGTQAVVNYGLLVWNGPFVVDSLVSIENRNTLTFGQSSLTYDSATPITNLGTLIFNDTPVTWIGPLTVEGAVVITAANHSSPINTFTGDVTFRDLSLEYGIFTGPGNQIITGAFRTMYADLWGTGTTTVASTGSFAFGSPTEYAATNLWGRQLIVQGQRVLPTEASPRYGYLQVFAVAPDSAGNPGQLYLMSQLDNQSMRAPQPVQPAPFNAINAAGRIYRAMYGGVIGAGTDEDAIYAALEPMITSDFTASTANRNALNAAYAQMYPNRSLSADLTSELSGDELKRALTLQTEQSWNRYVAVTIHEVLFGWRLTNDVDLICRLLRDPRTSSTSVWSAYSSEYGSELTTDLSAKLGAASVTQVMATSNGMTARASAAALLGLLRMDAGGYQIRTSENLYALLRNRSPQEMQEIRAEYALLRGSNSLDADVAAYLDEFPDYSGTVGNQIDYANALLTCDRTLIATRALRLAMDRLGTDENAVWDTLNGRYADERAAVVQRYYLLYNASLYADIVAEFSDSAVWGNELQRTLALFHHGGLTLVERVYFAVQGWGTDERMLQAALADCEKRVSVI